MRCEPRRSFVVWPSRSWRCLVPPGVGRMPAARLASGTCLGSTTGNAVRGQKVPSGWLVSGIRVGPRRGRCPGRARAGSSGTGPGQKAFEKGFETARLLWQAWVLTRKTGGRSFYAHLVLRRGVPTGDHGSLAGPFRKSTTWRQS